MIKFTVLYPTGEGLTFDHDYYANSHVPLAVSVFNPVKTEIEKGVNGPYAASVSFYFDSMESMQATLGDPRMGEVMADITNYTNSTPVSQISTVVD
jgi:uncharacterized protein (TIGR02118 family)